MKSLFIPLLFQLLFSATNLQCTDETKPFEGGGESDDTQQTTTVEGLKVTKATRIARITGRPVAGETILSPNNTAEDYNIGGTDSYCSATHMAAIGNRAILPIGAQTY